MPSSPSTAAASSITLGLLNSWPTTARLHIPIGTDAGHTTPAAVEITSAGDLGDQAVANGQQGVVALPMLIPCCNTPTSSPPTTLMTMMRFTLRVAAYKFTSPTIEP